MEMKCMLKKPTSCLAHTKCSTNVIQGDVKRGGGCQWHDDLSTENLKRQFSYFPLGSEGASQSCFWELRDIAHMVVSGLSWRMWRRANESKIRLGAPKSYRYLSWNTSRMEVQGFTLQLLLRAKPLNQGDKLIALVQDSGQRRQEPGRN